MDALLCRRTLLGHQDDVLDISGLHLAERGAGSPSHSSPPDTPGAAAANGLVLGGGGGSSNGGGFGDVPISPRGARDASHALFASASADGARSKGLSYALRSTDILLTRRLSLGLHFCSLGWSVFQVPPP